MSMDWTALAKPCVWRRFLESLLARGLHGVKLIVADDHAGLKAARRAVLPSVEFTEKELHNRGSPALQARTQRLIIVQ